MAEHGMPDPRRNRNRRAAVPAPDAPYVDPRHNKNRDKVAEAPTAFTPRTEVGVVPQAQLDAPETPAPRRRNKPTGDVT